MEVILTSAQINFIHEVAAQKNFMKNKSDICWGTWEFFERKTLLGFGMMFSEFIKTINILSLNDSK